MKAYLSLFLLLLVTGCGANPSATSTTGTGSGTTTPPPSSSNTPTSTLSGTYSGTLNTSGCPTVGACSGTPFSITLTQQPNASAPGQFLTSVAVTGTNNGAAFFGSGTATYLEAAAAGPGTASNNAYVVTNTGLQIYVDGTGTSATSSPVLVNSLSVHNVVQANGQNSAGPLYYGLLTRVTQ